MLNVTFGYNLSYRSREDFKILSFNFSLFRYYLPLEIGGTLHLNNIEFPFTTEWFVSVEIDQVVLETKFCQCIFAILSMYFSPWKKAWPLICRNLNSLKCALCQERLKFPQWLRKKRFKISQIYFSFLLLYPRGTGLAIHLNKVEFPYPKNALCQVWLTLAQWLGRRRFLNFINVFSLFWFYLHLEKGGNLHLCKFESTLPKDTLCQVWLK